MFGHRAHRGAALGVAAGGVLLGHWITYRIVLPGEYARDSLLAHTGHAYLGVANDLGLVLALTALSAVFLSRLTRSDAVPASTARWCARLAAFQVGAFAAMELVERLASDAPLAGLLHGGLLPLGLAIQVGVALVGAVAVRWLLRLADLARETGRATALRPPTGAVAWSPTATLVPVAVGHLAPGIRGPPSPA
jgi:hypothetical protein